MTRSFVGFYIIAVETILRLPEGCLRSFLRGIYIYRLRVSQIRNVSNIATDTHTHVPTQIFSNNNLENVCAGASW